MPDHVHLLGEARSEQTDLRTFVHDAKQASGYAFRRRFGRPLWQPSYYDRVLRNEESTPDIVRYIVANPVRAGLARDVSAYPYIGSSEYTRGELLEIASEGRGQP
jgi:REP element-mobilizing transposase RayT